MREPEKWIGLAKVTPSSDNSILEKETRAFVTVIGYAKTEVSFKKQVKEALGELNFYLDEIEDVEEFSKRVREYKIEKNISELAKEVDQTHKVRFGNFHTYEKK